MGEIVIVLAEMEKDDVLTEFGHLDSSVSRVAFRLSKCRRLAPTMSLMNDSSWDEASAPSSANSL